jgi:hypothetical protein
MNIRPLEPIYTALFALLTPLKNSGKFAVTSRRLQHVNDYDVSNMPACFQNQTGAGSQGGKTGLPRNRLTVDWYVYLPAGDETAATKLNEYVGYLAGALAPTTPGTKQTLGGLVEDCYIEGNIEMYEGVLHDRAVIIMPIVIVAPPYIAITQP